MLNIELAPEYVVTFLGTPLTNTFFTSIVVTAFLSALAAWFYTVRKSHNNMLIKAMRVGVYELLKLTDSVTEDRTTSKKILPLIGTFFLFIVTANLLALTPGFLGSLYVKTTSGTLPLVRSPDSDLTTTLALAIIAVAMIQYYSMSGLGLTSYIKRFINFSTPMKFVLGFFELLSEVTKVLSFPFRLFGNVFAGEVLLVVIAFLIPYLVPIPFLILEVFVGTIQAFIFAVLTLTFIKTSTISHTSATTGGDPS